MARWYCGHCGSTSCRSHPPIDRVTLQPWLRVDEWKVPVPALPECGCGHLQGAHGPNGCVCPGCRCPAFRCPRCATQEAETRTEQVGMLGEGARAGRNTRRVQQMAPAGPCTCAPRWVAVAGDKAFKRYKGRLMEIKRPASDEGPWLERLRKQLRREEEARYLEENEGEEE